MDLDEIKEEKISNNINDKEEIIKEVKENETHKKENEIKEINIIKKEKINKDNNQNIKIKMNKNNEKEKEIVNKRMNNFINLTNSNSNLHNRYYSSNISNHIFRNFIKKTNYNNIRDKLEENNEQNDFQLDFHYNDNRRFSFTSRNNDINKGLDYFLGTTNPNNIYNNKNIIDNKKNGFDYKKYNRGKRNNYINKNIFFNNIQNKAINEHQNINEIKINNNFQHNINIEANKPNYIRMNDILNLDNLELKIINIANNILSNITNNTIFFDNN